MDFRRFLIVLMFIFIIFVPLSADQSENQRKSWNIGLYGGYAQGIGWDFDAHVHGSHTDDFDLTWHGGAYFQYDLRKHFGFQLDLNFQLGRNNFQFHPYGWEPSEEIKKYTLFLSSINVVWRADLAKAVRLQIKAGVGPGSGEFYYEAIEGWFLHFQIGPEIKIYLSDSPSIALLLGGTYNFMSDSGDSDSSETLQFYRFYIGFGF